MNLKSCEYCGSRWFYNETQLQLSADRLDDYRTPDVDDYRNVFRCVDCDTILYIDHPSTREHATP